MAAAAFATDLVAVAHDFFPRFALYQLWKVCLGGAGRSRFLPQAFRRLPNIIREMFFTAAPIDAERALKWGIINHLGHSSGLEAFTMEAAQRMATKAPLAMAVIKEQLRVLSDYQPIPAQVFERIQDMRRKVYESADYREGIAAFKDKRKPVFEGE